MRHLVGIRLLWAFSFSLIRLLAGSLILLLSLGLTQWKQQPAIVRL